MGRELDELVFSRVMEKTCSVNSLPDTYGADGLANGGKDMMGTPHYSSDIAAAWDVVEKMRAGGRKVTIETGYFSGKCLSDVVVSSELTPHSCHGESVRNADTDETPLAICLAALRAVGVPDAEITKAQQGGGNGTPQA